MLFQNKSVCLTAGLLAMSVIIAACGGGSSGSLTNTTPQTNINLPVENPIDVSAASLVAAATKVTGGTSTASSADFSFPEVTELNGGLTMTIPNGPAPTFPARRTVASGSGQPVTFGDSVILKYDMFSWNSGQLVESSTEFDEAHIVQGGVSDTFPIPEYLAKSLLGRSLGDTVQVVLPVGTEDLPEYLDPNDAYVLLVEML